MNKAIRAIACAVLLSAAVAASAEVKTLTGRVSCSMCRNKHEMGKSSDAECVRACVKYGAKYVLMVGGDMYILEGDPKQFDYYADKVVTIRGDVDKGAIVKIESISVNK